MIVKENQKSTVGMNSTNNNNIQYKVCVKGKQTR